MITALLLAMTMALSLLPALPGAVEAVPARNTCAACHTSANRLIAITRDLAKGRPPVALSLSEGEG